MDNSVSITIFGDVCPVKETMNNFLSGNPEKIVSKSIIDIIKNSDFVIGNLECVLTDSPTPIKKAGPVLYAPEVVATTFKKIGFNIFGISNNHIRDCGDKGLTSTIESCRKNSIETFGAGFTINEAKKPIFLELNDIKIGLQAFSEHEFNVVNNKQGGASVFDPYEDLKIIKNFKNEIDYLIILYHGGIEYYPYPSPLLQKKCRAMIDAGADYVICQHSHCIGTFEEYNNGFILYGQGNNIFGHKKNNDSWNNGLILNINLTKEKKYINLIPCFTNQDNIFEQFDKSKANIIIQNIKNESKKIKDNNFIENEWIKFCSSIEYLDMPLLLGWNRYLNYLNRIFKGLPFKWIYNKKKLNIIHNMIRCESHNEVIQSLLSKYNFN